MSIKKEYKIDEPYELTATPISWLPEVASEDIAEDKQDGVLFVVSVPDYEVQDTYHMSKTLRLSSLKECISQSITIESIPEIKSKFESIDEELEAIGSISDGLTALNEDTTVCIENDDQMVLSDPYVLSSLTYSKGNVTSINGYKLAEALSAIVPNAQYSKGQFSQLYVAGSEVTAVKIATDSSAGIVKAKQFNEDEQIQDSIDVKIDDNAHLHISNADIINLVKSNPELRNALIAAIAPTLSAQIEKDLVKKYKFLKTQIVETDPHVYDADTLYYITGDE